MSFTLATAVFSLASLVAPQTPSVATPGDSAPRAELPVSLSRIREALKKPDPRLAVPPPKPDFKIEVNEEQRFRDLVDLLDFSPSPVVPAVWFGPAVGGSRTQPLVSMSVSDLGTAVVRSVTKARRARAERLAQEEVQRALIQFCASHECAAR
jgi:hypothetical protein